MHYMAYKLILSFRLLLVCFSTTQTAPKVMQNRRPPPPPLFILSELKITISKINSRGGHCSYPKLQKSLWTAQTAQSRFEIFAKEYSASGITKKKTLGWPTCATPVRADLMGGYGFIPFVSTDCPRIAAGQSHSWPLARVTQPLPLQTDQYFWWLTRHRHVMYILPMLLICSRE